MTCFRKTSLVAFALCLAFCCGLSPFISPCKANIPQSQQAAARSHNLDLTLHLLSCPSPPPSIPDTHLDVSGPRFQCSTRFPFSHQRYFGLTEHGKGWTGSTTHTGVMTASFIITRKTLTVGVCVLSPQDCVLCGVPAGEQSSTSFTFLPRVLPRLEEASLSQLQPR